jgi:hypothetical protein
MTVCSVGYCADDTSSAPAGKSSEQLTSGFDRTRPNEFVENMKMVGRYAALYIPNRLLDASDLISMEAGFGGEVSMQFYATQYLQFGGAHGCNYFIEKGFDRQCGGGYRDGKKFGVLCFSSEDFVIDDTFGSVRNCVVDSRGFQIADSRMDAYRDNEIDFWAVGGRFGWLCDLGVNFHPYEVVDFVTSCFCYDLRKDDLK